MLKKLKFCYSMRFERNKAIGVTSEFIRREKKTIVVFLLNLEFVLFSTNGISFLRM